MAKRLIPKDIEENFMVQDGVVNCRNDQDLADQRFYTMDKGEFQDFQSFVNKLVAPCYVCDARSSVKVYIFCIYNFFYLIYFL